MVEPIIAFITGLPPVMQGVVLCAGIIYAPQIFKWVNDKRNGNEKNVIRHGDIQMSTGNKLNHMNEFMVLVADRLKIDRPGD